GVAAGTPIAGGASNVLDGYYNTAMNRTTARNRGFGLMDYAPLLNRQAFGFDPTRRAQRQVPQRTVSLSPTTPVSLAEECLDCSMWIGAGGATDAAGWTALQQLDIQISTNPGNRLMLRMGSNGNIWAASSAYGLTVNTTVTVTAGSNAIALGAPTPATANVTVQGLWPQAYCTDGSVTFTSAMVGQCVVWATGNKTGTTYQPQRNYIRQCYDTNNIALHEITHDGTDVVLASFRMGNQFIPQDAGAHPDVLLFYADGTVFNTQVASYTSATQATLVDNAPQTLAAVSVPMFIGRMSLKWFDTGLKPSTTTATGLVCVNLIGGELLLGYLDDVVTSQIPMYSVFRTVERFGGACNPVLSSLGSA